ncbi:none [Acinetobacter radioresistens]|uniref:none n=1 Tax=Acinetobacter TaxID=469 RepID=UPI0021CD3DEB|nr:none [Acinetobacter radioresistens]MCU4500007.1 hypothetical protein [Acinetobacter radioresistens]
MLNPKTIEDADQTELEAVFNSYAPVDAGIVDDKHASALDSIDLIDDIASSWTVRDAELDSMSSDVSTEINNRLNLLNDAYPFTLESSSLKIKIDSKNIFYIFCLILSNSKLKARKGEEAHNQKMARFFERITLKIIKNSLGEFSNFYHFGFPRDDNSNIETAMQALKSQLKLTHEMNVNLLEYNVDDLKYQKDLGIDQIIWIKRPDNRSHSHLFLLGQCACGQDYKQKYNDIDIRKLESYFRPFTFVSPIKMMSIPFILTDGEMHKISTSAGWIFDRISLSSLYNKFDNLQQEFNSELIELISNSTPHGEKFKASFFYEALRNEVQ